MREISISQHPTYIVREDPAPRCKTNLSFGIISIDTHLRLSKDAWGKPASHADQRHGGTIVDFLLDPALPPLIPPKAFAATSGSHRAASAWKSLQPSATRATGSRENALSAVSVGKEIDPVYGGKKAATEVVVVGAGVGGLATAARLAKAGCRCVQRGYWCCGVSRGGGGRGGADWPEPSAYVFAPDEMTPWLD